MNTVELLASVRRAQKRLRWVELQLSARPIADHGSADLERELVMVHEKLSELTREMKRGGR